MSQQTSTTYALFVATLSAIIGVTALMHIVGAFSLQSSFWGMHLYAFFHPAVVIVASILPAVACAIVVRHKDGINNRIELVPDPTPARAGITVTVSSILAGVLYWFGRARHTYLGDGNVLIDNVPAGHQFHPREPLTMYLQEQIHDSAAPLFGAGTRPADAVAQDALATGSVFAGMAFVLVAWLLAREIVALASLEDAKTSGAGLSILVTAVILAQGYVMLFFGYVENYAFYTVAAAFYLWAALKFMRGRLPLLVPLVVLIGAMALHLVGIVLVPSLFVLIVWSLMRRSTRMAAIRDLAIGAIVFSILVWISFKAKSGYNPFTTILELTGLALTRKGESAGVFSADHLRDFVNEQTLIGPLGIVMFLGGVLAAFTARTWRAVAGVFFVTAGGAYLVASVFAGDSNLGYARDWDVWAPGGVVFTAAGLGLFSLGITDRRSMAAPLVCALVISLYHTVPWVAVNASEDRALARLKTLPLGRGRTEVLVGAWYDRKGDTPQAKAWYRQAIRTNSNNNNAHYLLASIAMDERDFDLAVTSLEQAIALRPDKMLFREMIIRALFLSGRGSESIPHLDEILKREPDNATKWALYGEALKSAGRTEDARSAFERALPLYVEKLLADPQEFQTNFGLGNIHYNLEQYDEAYRYFDAAAKIDPQRDSAWYYAGYALKNMGRVEDATRCFQKCFSLNPTHPDREAIEKWIRESDR